MTGSGSAAKGDRTRDLQVPVNQQLPQTTPAPLEFPFFFGPDHVITDLDVTVDISHPYSYELIVSLESPQGTSVRLHDNSGGLDPWDAPRYDLDRLADGPGSMVDFNGESTAGEWRLIVEDTVVSPVFSSWVNSCNQESP